ncbi:kallikrein-7 [Culex quinquefasciatus]|uniref:Kallikrein-7 n=1 Tax=Culex quinquefasciatus TaxID=7176 RepID=B0X819_CULQU|nr:kallikrein-7 [Culex quinquefasciatus]|eukprot:XP_001865791.1 kallikrein-7 [Culex quinquefasciatus]
MSLMVLGVKLRRSGLNPTMCNFLINLLSEKHMHFVQGDLAITRISYMGLAQGSRLSPSMYNFYVSDIDDCLTGDCALIGETHCFKSKPTAVRMGTISATDALADSYPVANTFRHPDHNRKTKQNDIGLVELRTEVQMSANVEPICLHAELADLPASANLTILGWGITNLNRQETSDDLLTGLVHPVPRSSCQSMYNDWNLKITERQLCAIGEQDSMGEYTDACSGDSGGPLVMRKDKKYFLVGVVSTGSGCGSGVPGVYTRVANYLQWTSERVWSA